MHRFFIFATCLVISFCSHQLVQAQATTQVTPVFLTIDNAVRSGTTYEFDVSAETADTLVMNTFQIYFAYNNAAFGTSIVANGQFSDTLNNNPNVTLLGNFPPPLNIPKYKLINVVDNTSQIVAITADTRLLVPTPACYPADTNRVVTWLPGEKKAFAHITMTMTDTTQAPGVSLVLTLMVEQFIGGNGRRCQLVQGDPSILPVKFLEVAAAPVGPEAVHVSWTALEEAQSHYEVERQTGSGMFVPIGRLKARGEAEVMSYGFVDEAAPRGQVHYRVSATDIDGSIHYSETVTVQTETAPARLQAVYPNPVSDRLYIKGLPQGQAPPGRISDPKGRTIWQGTLDSNGLSVRDLPRGIYILRIMGAGGTNHRFIKQ